MKMQMVSRSGALTLAAALALAPAPSDALPPLIAMFVKEIVKQTFKDMLLGSLRDQGCKGMALANAISALDVRKGGLGGDMPGGLGAMPKMPAGMPGAMPKMPAGMPGAMPTMPAGMSGAMPTLPPGMAMPMMPGAVAGGAAGAGALGALMPNVANMPPGMAMTPEQMAMMADLQKAMSEPLSPTETLAVMDEMAELGMLPKAIHTEMKECMVLLPQTAAAMGMGMAMLKPVIPQMREGRDMMRRASPEEQDEMIATMVEQLQTVPAGERKSVTEMLDSGFFPPRVSEGVKAQLAKSK